jgi:hypothetical protein
MFSIIILAIYIFIHYYNYTTTTSTLEKHFVNKIETQHFKIFFSNKIKRKEQQYLSKLHEYYFKDLSELFESSPNIKITSYIFDDSYQKKSLVGAGSADVAKPWLNQIYISADSYETSLKHELAHIFTADFGRYIFKVAHKFNTGLIEGIAAAADFQYDDMTPHYLAKTAFQNDYIINLNDIFSTFGFFKSVSTLSYIYAGSFIKYLIDSYGIEKVKELYSNLNFETIYKKKFADLQNEYYKFLTSLSDSVKSSTANYYFGRKALIQKICPRYFASKVSEVMLLINGQKYREALNLISKIETKSDNYILSFAKIVCLEKLMKYEDAISYCEDQIKKYVNTTYEFNLKIKKADLLCINNKFTYAKEIYNQLMHDYPNARITYVVKTRLMLLDEPNILVNYILSRDSLRFKTLAKHFEKKNDPAFIPILVSLADDLNVDEKEIISLVKDNLSANDFLSFFSAIKLAEYFLSKLQLDIAEKYVKIANEYSILNPYSFLLEEINSKVTWFKINSDKY